jgi:hypoxanthine phosphoribosyltransferase
MKEELNLTWADVEQGVSIIINRIGNKKYDYVIGIANGGLIPATLIAKKLKLKTLSVGVTSYENTEQLKTITMWSEINDINHPYKYGTCLIVDDISDSGKTFSFLKKYCLNEGEILTDSASLVVKPKTSFMPDYFAMSVSNDVWVKFPWE